MVSSLRSSVGSSPSHSPSTSRSSSPGASSSSLRRQYTHTSPSASGPSLAQLARPSTFPSSTALSADLPASSSVSVSSSASTSPSIVSPLPSGISQTSQPNYRNSSPSSWSVPSRHRNRLRALFTRQSTTSSFVDPGTNDPRYRNSLKPSYTAPTDPTSSSFSSISSSSLKKLPFCVASRHAILQETLECNAHDSIFSFGSSNQSFSASSNNQYLAKRTFVLTSRAILRYPLRPSSTSVPDLVVKLGPDSVAYASDDIVGRQYVLRIAERVAVSKRYSTTSSAVPNSETDAGSISDNCIRSHASSVDYGSQQSTSQSSKRSSLFFYYSSNSSSRHSSVPTFNSSLIGPTVTSSSSSSLHNLHLFHDDKPKSALLVFTTAPEFVRWMDAVRGQIRYIRQDFSVPVSPSVSTPVTTTDMQADRSSVIFPSFDLKRGGIIGEPIESLSRALSTTSMKSSSGNVTPSGYHTPHNSMSSKPILPQLATSSLQSPSDTSPPSALSPLSMGNPSRPHSLSNRRDSSGFSLLQATLQQAADDAERHRAGIPVAFDFGPYDGRRGSANSGPTRTASSRSSRRGSATTASSRRSSSANGEPEHEKETKETIPESSHEMPIPSQFSGKERAILAAAAPLQDSRSSKDLSNLHLASGGSKVNTRPSSQCGSINSDGKRSSSSHPPKRKIIFKSPAGPAPDRPLPRLPVSSLPVSSSVN
ncbi:uncharacterized protein V1516DRAFT_219444 [Lipomyces oligophaga]|uniref:uncharacterized protein n=1 Tax=Lipomyces oligophaga TaxID=45792 RepID=UPI0034CD610B